MAKRKPNVTTMKPRRGNPHMTTKNPAAIALGRLGGSQNTPAQVKARLKNAKRAGRPGRVCADCGQPVLGGHKDARLNATCPGRTWTWGEPRNRQDTPKKKKTA
jgi:hypothetical protein